MFHSHGHEKGLTFSKLANIADKVGWAAPALYFGVPQLLKNPGIANFVNNSNLLSSFASAFSEPNSALFSAVFPGATVATEMRRRGHKGKSLVSDVIWLGADAATVAVAGMTFGSEISKVMNGVDVPNVPLLLASLHVLTNVVALRFSEIKHSKGFGTLGRVAATVALMGSAAFFPYAENKASIDNLVDTARNQFNIVLSPQEVAQIQSLGEPQKGVSAQAMSASADAIDQNVQNVVAETVKGASPNFVTRALNSVANGARAQDEEIDLIPQVVVAESVKDASPISPQPIIPENPIQPPADVSPTEIPNSLDQCDVFYTVTQSDIDETARIQAILGRDGLGLLEVTAKELKLSTIDQIAKGSADQLKLNSAFSAICNVNLTIDQGFDCGNINTSQPPICVPEGIR